MITESKTVEGFNYTIDDMFKFAKRFKIVNYPFVLSCREYPCASSRNYNLYMAFSTKLSNPRTNYGFRITDFNKLKDPHDYKHRPFEGAGRTTFDDMFKSDPDPICAVSNEEPLETIDIFYDPGSHRLTTYSHPKYYLVATMPVYFSRVATTASAHGDLLNKPPTDSDMRKAYSILHSCIPREIEAYNDYAHCVAHDVMITDHFGKVLFHEPSLYRTEWFNESISIYAVPTIFLAVAELERERFIRDNGYVPDEEHKADFELP